MIKNLVYWYMKRLEMICIMNSAGWLRGIFYVSSLVSSLGFFTGLSSMLPLFVIITRSSNKPLINTNHILGNREERDERARNEH